MTQAEAAARTRRSITRPGLTPVPSTATPCSFACASSGRAIGRVAQLRVSELLAGRDDVEPGATASSICGATDAAGIRCRGRRRRARCGRRGLRVERAPRSRDGKQRVAPGRRSARRPSPPCREPDPRRRALRSRAPGEGLADLDADRPEPDERDARDAAVPSFMAPIMGRAYPAWTASGHAAEEPERDGHEERRAKRRQPIAGVLAERAPKGRRRCGPEERPDDRRGARRERRGGRRSGRPPRRDERQKKGPLGRPDPAEREADEDAAGPEPGERGRERDGDEARRSSPRGRPAASAADPSGRSAQPARYAPTMAGTVSVTKRRISPPAGRPRTETA